MPNSFDRVLLDAPCSALGLRPRLFVGEVIFTISSLAKCLFHSGKFHRPWYLMLFHEPPNSKSSLQSHVENLNGMVLVLIKVMSRRTTGKTFLFNQAKGSLFFHAFKFSRRTRIKRGYKVEILELKLVTPNSKQINAIYPIFIWNIIVVSGTPVQS